MAWNWAVNDIAEVTLEGKMYGQVTMNVFHYRLKVAGLTPGFDAAEDLYATLIGGGSLTNDVLNIAVASWVAKYWSVQRVQPTRQRRYDFAVEEPGIAAGTQLTANLAATIQTYTENATEHDPGNPQGQVGSKHFAGCPSSQMENGLWKTDWRTGELAALAEAIAKPQETAGGNTWEPVIYHRNSTPVSATLIEGCLVQETVRVMRRRTVGLGI